MYTIDTRIKRITNEMYSTGNLVLCGDLNEKEIQESEDMCIHIADSFGCTAETNNI